MSRRIAECNDVIAEIAAARRVDDSEERHAARTERPEQQAECRPHRRLGPGNRALQRPQGRERRRALRRQRSPHQGSAGDLPQGQNLLGLAAHARPEGRRGRHHLHRRSPPRLHRQLGAESRHARLLREAARHHGGRSRAPSARITSSARAKSRRSTARSATPIRTSNACAS